MIHMNKTQRGFALVISLLLLLMMTVMGITMIARSNLNTNMSVEYDKSEHIFIAAEAGIEHARRYLENMSSKNQYPGNNKGPLTATPANRCLADYKDGQGSPYDTLGKDSGKYAYTFPAQQTNGVVLNTQMSCKNLNSGQNDKNFRRMDCEFDLDNDATSNQNERNFFKTFGFSYYIFYEGESSTAGGSGSSGVGTVGTSSQYAASKQNSAYYYQVISCGASFAWDGKSQNATLKQIQSLEARIKLEK